MDDEIRTTRAWRGPGYGLKDLAMIAACCFAFAIIVIGKAPPDKGPPAKGPPLDLIARDLGTTPGHLHEVTDRILPRHRPPTKAQKEQIATALDVSVERLDAVMARYRPDRRAPPR